MRHHRVALLVVVWTVVAAGPLHAQSERPGTRVWLSLGLALARVSAKGFPGTSYELYRTVGLPVVLEAGKADVVSPFLIH